MASEAKDRRFESYQVHKAVPMKGTACFDYRVFFVTIPSHAKMRGRTACRPKTTFLYGEWGSDWLRFLDVLRGAAGSFFFIRKSTQPGQMHWFSNERDRHGQKGFPLRLHGTD